MTTFTNPDDDGSWHVHVPSFAVGIIIGGLGFWVINTNSWWMPAFVIAFAFWVIRESKYHA